MSDFLDTGCAWLADTFKSDVSQSVTYRRGSHTLTGLKASVGRSDQAMLGPYGGVTVQRDSISFVITGADLVISGAATEPRVGDLIDFNGDRYLVAQPEDSQPCFFWDEYGRVMTIHTKWKATI